MKVQNYFYTLFLLVLIFWLLHIGKSLLIPLVLALFVWYMIKVLAQVIQKLPMRYFQIPTLPSYIFAIALIAGITSLLISLITSNVSQIAKVAPEYQQNVSRLVSIFFQYLPVDEPPPVASMLEQLNFGSLLRQFALTITGLTGNLGMVFIYLIFIFMEQKSFHPKLKAILARNSSTDEIDFLLRQIDSDIRKYLGIKSFTSALTGIVSYMLMKAIGLDFAEFWAIMIFVLNYIPTIGSIVAVIFPVSLAFVQFANIYMFFLTLGGLTVIQILIGNILDPRLLGNTLNLSPIMILLSLTLWGSIWGPTGMILCVPITAILIIILSHFPKTEALAILLSKDGHYKKI